MKALNRKITTAVVGISVSAAIAGCASTDAEGTSSPSTASSGVAPSGPSPEQGPAYTDGEYSADGWYGGKPSSIGVAVTLEDDVITDVEVTPHATDVTSLSLQKRFAAAVPALVVGRDIDEVTLDRVAGNSGTPKGFNDALDRIKEKASG
ncbi:hypothetical protein ACIA6D_29865 [Streptomyces cacaoi]|uniref:hypothetical protein n=1 Tax=Streptomyces cacaoi TaxID=1898 RepID=UPI0037482D45